ncbi:MAG: inner membrane CreD family protein [Vicinamibacterales bacterium]
MTVRRLFAIAGIFLGTSAAWAVLGASLVARTGEFDSRLEREVHALWGAPQRQVAAVATLDRPAVETEVVESKDATGRLTRTEIHKDVVRPVVLTPASTRAIADVRLEHRQKGLLWYATYEVRFQATYRFTNPDAEPRTVRLQLPLPEGQVLFDDVTVRVDGQPAAGAGPVGAELTATTTAAPNAAVAFEVGYRSRGVGTWTYAFAREGVAQVRDFQLVLTTNVGDVDYPLGSVSPSQRIAAGPGATLTWSFANLVTGQHIALGLPDRINPGPFAARVTFFAPVSLLFFLAVMVMVGVTAGESLHPMHYWFLSAAFFAFHLLLAYLVDHMPVSVAFAIAAAVSVFLVVSYLRVVTGMRRAVGEAGAAQLVFLVLFSYAFFFQGMTGLAITIGAVVTLFVMMQMTAAIPWDDVFAAPERYRGGVVRPEGGHERR